MGKEEATQNGAVNRKHQVTMEYLPTNTTMSLMKTVHLVWEPLPLGGFLPHKQRTIIGMC